MNVNPDPEMDTGLTVGGQQIRTLAVFGDSIANGLGVAERRFPVLLADALKFELQDFSGSAQPVSVSLEVFRSGSSAPHIALIAHGATEAMIRPTDSSLRFLPARWKRMGWMDPRPYYSRRWRRRLVEKCESALRWRIKNLLIRRYGGRQVIPAEEFTSKLEELVALLQSRGTQTIIVVVPPDLDEGYFPGTPAAQVEYFDGLSLPDVEVVNLKDELAKWDDFFADRFHPNTAGHRRIAEILLKRLCARL